MHRTTIQLSQKLWEMVQEHADQQGISASQFIREAALAAVFYDQGIKSNREVARALRIAREMRKAPPG